MPVFLVGTVRITDAEAFGRYAVAVRGMAAKHGGEPIISGPVTRVLEGGSPLGERVVVTRFPSTDDALGYLASADYKAAVALRAGAAEAEIRLIEV